MRSNQERGQANMKNHIVTCKVEQGIPQLYYGTHSETGFGAGGLIIKDVLWRILEGFE